MFTKNYFGYWFGCFRMDFRGLTFWAVLYGQVFYLFVYFVFGVGTCVGLAFGFAIRLDFSVWWNVIPRMCCFGCCTCLCLRVVIYWGLFGMLVFISRMLVFLYEISGVLLFI